MLGTLLGIRRGSSARPNGSEARAALSQGDLGKLRELLEASPSLALQLSPLRDNLLGVAARAGQAEAVQLLVRIASFAGSEAALLNHRNSNGDTALALAAAGGHVEAVVSLLSKPSININLANGKGNTPLHHAIANGNTPIVLSLLGNPAVDPNVKNAEGHTPLHLAVARDDKHVTEMLLTSRGCQVNLRDRAGQTPLLAALKGGKLEAAAELLRHPDVRVTATDEHGNTLLHRMVAEGGFQPTSITLLASDLDLANRPNHLGETPLQLAIRGDQHEALHALLKGGNIDTESEDDDLQSPLQEAIKRIADTPASSVQLKRRIETLRLLVESPFVDSNLRFNNGQTLLTELCAMGAGIRDARAREQQLHFACETLAALLEAKDSGLDLNKPNAKTQAPLALAASQRNGRAIIALLDDARTDPNVLSKWLVDNPKRSHSLLKPGFRFAPDHEPDHALSTFVQETLATWADKVAPNGKHFHLTHYSNAALGLQLASSEKANAAHGKLPPETCAKGGVFRLSLALEQCLAPKYFRFLGERARQLLKHAPADLEHFNLNGVDVPRQEVEGWAAGKLPDDGVNRVIEANVAADGLADVHGAGLTARGKQIMQEINRRLPAERLAPEQCIAGVRAAIAAATDATPQWRAKATKGLELALAHQKRVGEGLDTTVREALSSMWNHIQSYAAAPHEVAGGGGPKEAARTAAERESLRGALTHSLLENMVDMSAGYCDTGCVQRILYAVDGVDLSLFPSQPTHDIVNDEVTRLAGAVNNRFENLYGQGAEAPDDTPSSSTAPPLTAAERLLIESYQGQDKVDDNIVLEVKQDMLEAAVLAELVERRGWREELVRPELDRTKKMMEYL